MQLELAGGQDMKMQYDDDAFFSAYGRMERSQGGLEASGEWSTLKPLIPSVEGRHVLDLGCGYGRQSGIGHETDTGWRAGNEDAIR